MTFEERKQQALELFRQLAGREPTEEEIAEIDAKAQSDDAGAQAPPPETETSDSNSSLSEPPVDTSQH